MTAAGADLGLAFDGDGDRLLAVGADGVPLDGDQIIAILALDLRRRGRLDGDAVVVTTMTNLGFRRAWRPRAIKVRWTDVGDRYVLEEMRRGGYALGGEQSGHVINLRHGPSGDGLAAALHLLDALAARGETLAEAGRVMQRLPAAARVNVRVERKGDIAGARALSAAVASPRPPRRGRPVRRARVGRRPLVRVIVEAPTADECDVWCATIAEVAARELGGRIASSADAPA